MEELDVTPMEEMDLLVKYLGPVSCHYAISLRAANATQPQRGLVRIWERLDERFACPEASVQKKLVSRGYLTKITKLSSTCRTF